MSLVTQFYQSIPFILYELLQRWPHKEWLKESIENGNIQFYAYRDFTESLCTGIGRYGAVFRAKSKSLDSMVAYKPLHSENEDEMFENVVEQVGIMMIICAFGYFVT